MMMSRKRDFKKRNYYSIGCNYCQGTLAPTSMQYNASLGIINSKEEKKLEIYVKEEDEKGNYTGEKTSILKISINFCWHCGKQLVKRPLIDE
jgi:hypothetical protein